MSFGGLFDEVAAGGGGAARLVGDYTYGSASSMPPGSVSQPLMGSRALSKSILSSPGLSLGLQTNDRILVGGAGAGGGAAGEPESLRRHREEENDSRSGSDNMEGVSGDEEPENPRKKKRYHRHTPQQIQELEALFKESPHPDEKQRSELSKRLCLETRQVKFWFQNRRTQMKTQMERHENNLLRQENDRLRNENLTIRDVMRNPICTNCGGQAQPGEISVEEQHLRIENARLRDELERVCALAAKFLGKPFSALVNTSSFSVPNSSLELAVGSNSFTGMGSLPPMNLPPVADFASAGVSSPLGTVITPARNIGGGTMGGAVFLEIALSAMEELTKMVQMDDPLWIPSLDGGKETLNYEEYNRFPRCIGPKQIGFVFEATRETGMVLINSLALIDALMDPNRWAEMLPSLVSRTTAADVIFGGMGGTRNGTLQLMKAELQVLSPLVPIREVHFLRFCKQLGEGVWAIVDVSVNGIDGGIGLPLEELKCRRLPSGCVVQDMQNGYSKVTWVEHVEYDEATIHPLYRPLFSSGAALGALRWIATLQRQCQSLVLLTSPLPVDDDTTITPNGRRSMLKLARRMTDNFCAGVCASSARQWSRLGEGLKIGEDVRVLTRQSVDDPGEPPGVVLSAATSVWLAVPPQQLFDFLRDEKLRSEWDILSNGGPMEKMNFISKGHAPGNEVCLLRANAVSANQSSMLILQETCTDASGSLVVYAPVDIPAMHLVMSGGDSAYVALLPSGFAILPDGSSTSAATAVPAGGVTNTRTAGGSLLTVAFQILVNSQPTAKLTMESVETVNSLITCTIHKIKAALNLDS